PQVPLDKLADFSSPFTHQPDDVHVGARVARHHAEQRALADAGAREDAEPLAAAAGEERVDRPDAEVEWLADRPALERVHALAVERVDAVALDGAAAVERPPEAVDDAAAERVADADHRLLAHQQHLAPRRHAGEVAERHEQHTAGPEADHLGEDAALVARRDAAERAHGRARTARLDDEPDHVGHPSAHAHGVELAEPAAGAREVEVGVARPGAHPAHPSSARTSARSTASSCTSTPRFTSPKRLSMMQPPAGRLGSSTRSSSLTASSDALSSGSASRRKARSRGGTRTAIRSRSTTRRTAARKPAAAAGGPPRGANSGSDKGVLPAAAEGDLLLLLEPAHDADDVRLRLLDVLQAHGAHAAHVLLQDLGGALRDVAEDLVAHGRARGLEGQHQVLARDLLQHHLHAAVVEPDEVLEGEHEVADVLGDLGHLGIELCEDTALEVLVGRVQDLGGELRPFELAGLPDPAESLDLHLEDLAHLAQHVVRDALQVGDAVDDVGPERVR